MAVDRAGMVRMGPLGAAALAVASPATAAETPSALWQGVDRVGVTCLVNTDRGVDTGALRQRLCRRVQALTAAGAPVPVSAVEVGDAQMFAPAALTLLVHASTAGTPGGRMMAVSIRPYRHGDTGLLFGAEPRVVATDADDAALDAALTVPLAQILPWRPSPARPLN